MPVVLSNAFARAPLAQRQPQRQQHGQPPAPVPAPWALNTSQLSRLSPSATIQPPARRAVQVQAEQMPALEAVAGPTVQVAGVRLPRCEAPANAQGVPSAEQARMVVTPSMAEPMRYLCKAWVDRVPVRLEGATGVGKTAAIRHLAHVTNSEYIRVNLSYFTEVEDLLGRYVGGTREHTPASLARRSDEALCAVARGLGLVPDGGREALIAKILRQQGQVRWVDGPVVKAVKGGAVLLLDEMNLARPEVIEALNGLFDRGQLVSGKDVQQVDAHPNFRVFATQNPASYAGRQDMSQALSSRWSTLTWEPLPAAELSTILTARYADRLPCKVFSKLCKAHTELADLAEAGLLGQDRGGVAFTLRDLFKVAERYIRYRPRNAASMSDSVLVAREAFEVYLGGLDDPEDLAKARAILARALLRIGQDFYRDLQLEKTATGWRLGDVELDARSPEARFVPVTDLVMTPTLLPIYARLLKALDMGENVALVGERASGKSAMAEAYAAHSQRPFFPEHFDAGMDGSRLIGTDTPQGWQDGLLLHAARGGGLLLADEFNLAPPEILERLNSLLDDERVLVLSEKEGERVELHPDFCFVATMNPPKYAGRHKVSRAMLNRLTCIAVPTLEAAKDLRPIVDHKLARGHAHVAPAVNDAVASAIIDVHTWASDAYRTGALGTSLRRKEIPDYSLRQVLHAVRLLMRFSGEEGVARALRDALLMGYAQQGAPSDKKAVRARIDTAVQAVEALVGPQPTTAPALEPSFKPASGRQVLFRDGGVYYGETRDGHAHGHGTMQLADGSLYEGGWQDGLRHGQGVWHSHGITYTGGFARGEYHGTGSLTLPNGNSYDGAFAEGVFAGDGTFRFANGDQYTGSFARGTCHGMGTLVHANGARVEGEFEDGQLIRGTLRAVDGTECSVSVGPSRRRGIVPMEEGVVKLQGDTFEFGLMEWVNSCPANAVRAYERAADEIRTVRRDQGHRLQLRGGSLRTLPPEIGMLGAHLLHLDVSGNLLTALPPEIGQLTRLRELDAAQCSLGTLSVEIGQLQALEALNVAQNGLRSLPPELGQCQSLKRLKVPRNELRALPPELGALSRLRHLDAAQNKITQLPDSVRSWGDIDEVDLSENLLTGLPADLSSWTRLKSLLLSRNPHLTEVDAKLTVSRVLDLGHCPALTRLGPVDVLDALELSHCSALVELPAGLRVGGRLILNDCTALEALPADLWVGWRLQANNCTGLRRLGPRTHVGQHCDLSICTALEALTEPLVVGGDLNLNHCAALVRLGAAVQVRGNLSLRHCTGFKELPDGFAVGGDLDLTGCTALTRVPANLDVGEGLDLYGCTALCAIGDGLSVGHNVNLTKCSALKHLSMVGWRWKPLIHRASHRVLVKGAGFSAKRVKGVSEDVEFA